MPSVAALGFFKKGRKIMHDAIAIISDIHSNRFALEAVLEDISTRNIQRIVNLGDSLFGPVDPLGTAKRLMEHDKIVHIMGNCDAALLEKEMDSATFQYVKPLLGREIEEWIRTFKDTWVYKDLFFCHGTPYANDRYLLETIDGNGVSYKKPDFLMKELGSISQNYIFCGHSHVPKSIFLPDGKLIVNPGSVGLPAYEEELPVPHKMESLSPFADYVIAYQTEMSVWNIEHVMVQYDWEQAGSMAESNGRMDYAVAIRTGRVT
ncbi:metallophosphatase family protein [Paenibacillus sp. alder61]|uniref:metallophosphoesterase family protein n=1 Tax=Paenibacillus sp. alder61 TaxID=2862948 RepID=UPI001CD3B818|nr:metallophosphoesterase family protein [Paenibacillus sp. alder61]MCA1295431.1 metallophosphatase family protein [Paenibacillus sp. alder61]